MDACSGTNVIVGILSTVTNGLCPLVVTRTWLAVDLCGNTNTCSQTVTVLPSLAFTSPNSPAVISGPIYNPANGHVYYLLNENTWTASEVEAVGLGGHLATVRNLAENNWIYAQFSQFGGTNRGLWIGLNDVDQPGHPPVVGNFVWVSGEQALYRNWASGEPANQNGLDDYVHLFWPGDTAGRQSQWNDQWDIIGSDSVGIPINGVVEISNFPPPLTCATNKTVQCGTAWTFDPPTATGSCSGTNVTVGVLSTVTNGLCPLVMTRTWLATDVCGNTNTCSQTVTVATSLTFFPVTINGNGSTVSTYTSPYGNGNISVTLSHSNTPANSGAAYDGSVVSSKFLDLFPLANNGWSINAQGARAIGNGTFYITVDLTQYNNTSPSFLIGFYNIQDSTLPGTYSMAAFDAMGAQISPPFTWNLIGNDDDALHLGANAHLVLDPATGLFSATASQTGYGSDAAFWNHIPTNTAKIVITGMLPSTSDGVALYFAEPAPPVLTCATNKTVECGSSWSFDPPTGVSGCSGTNNITVAVLNTVTNGICPQMITRTWTATDACSNSATCSQTVTVEDTTPPTLTCSTNKTVQCGSSWTFDPPTAVDTCSGTNVIVGVFSTVTNGICPQVITRTWLAIDLCGNTATCSQIVTVSDTNAPVLTCATNKTVQCGSSWSFDPPTAVDACSGTNVIVGVLDTVTNGICPQIITRIWLAIDLCGNTNTCSQSVTVVNTNMPVIICPTNIVVTSCSNTNLFYTVLATDGCNTNLTAVCTPPSGSSFAPGTTTTVNCVAANCAGSAKCSFTVTVQCATNSNPCTNNLVVNGSFEVTSPVLAANTSNNSLNPLTGVPGWTTASSNYLEIWCNNVGIPASDGTNQLEINAQSADETVSQTVTGLSTNCLAYFCFNYTGRFGLAGNAVGPDTANNDFTVTLSSGSFSFTVPLDPAAYASGGWLSFCTNFIPPSSTVTIAFRGHPHYSDGTAATQGGAHIDHVSLTQCCNTTPTNSCVTAPTNMVLWLPFDETSGTTSANLVPGGNNGTQVGSPAVTIGYVDHSLTFNGVNQYVEVPTYAAINFGTNDFSIDAWVTRPTNDIITSVRTIVDTRTVSSSVTGYSLFLESGGTLAFQLADGSFSNYSSSFAVPSDGQWHHVAVTVARSNTNGLVFYLDGAADPVLQNPVPHSGSVSTTLPLRVAALASSPVRNQFLGGIDEVELFNRVLGANEIAMIFNARSAGKCKPAYVAPLVVNCATNKTVQCGSSWNFDPPTVASYCGTYVTLNILGTVTNGICPQIITCTWIATDACSNSVTCSQVVTNVDTTPPTLTCATNKTVICGSSWTFDPPTAVDVCSGTNVIVGIYSLVTNATAIACQSAITCTWLAVDVCGNTNMCSQTVTMINTNLPVIVCPKNIVVTSCTATQLFYTVTAMDGCNSSLCRRLHAAFGQQLRAGNHNHGAMRGFELRRQRHLQLYRGRAVRHQFLFLRDCADEHGFVAAV